MKRINKLYYLLFLVFGISLTGSAQVLIYHGDTMRHIHQPVILDLDDYTADSIGWQYSDNNVSWQNLTDLRSDSLVIDLFKHGTYRALVYYGICKPFPSSAARVTNVLNKDTILFTGTINDTLWSTGDVKFTQSFEDIHLVIKDERYQIECFIHDKLSTKAYTIPTGQNDTISTISFKTGTGNTWLVDTSTTAVKITMNNKSFVKGSLSFTAINPATSDTIYVSNSYFKAPKAYKNKLVTPKSLDLSEARSLVVYGNNLKSTQNDSHRNGNLYIVKEDGKITKIMLRDQNGKPFEKIVYYYPNGDTLVNYPKMNVKSITAINNDYKLIEGEFSYLDISGDIPTVIMYTNILLRNSDGALFNFDDRLDPRWKRFMNFFLYSDTSNNFYYRSANTREDNIQRLAMDSAGQMTRTNILPYGHGYRRYFVDGSGNLFYQERDDYSGAWTIKVAGGGIVKVNFEDWNSEISTPEYHTEIRLDNFYPIWTNENKKVNALFTERTNDLNGHEIARAYKVFQFGFTETGFEIIDTIVDYKIPTEDSINLDGLADYSAFKLVSDTNVIFIDGDVGLEPKTKIWSVSEKSNKIRFNILPITEPDFIEAIMDESKDFIYLSAKGSLFKISKHDFTYTNFLPPDEYEIFKMSLNGEGEIIFNALRNSDAKIILAKIKTDGTLEVIRDDFKEPVVVLERIN